MTKTIAEYIWIDANNGLRSKCKVFNLHYENSDIKISHFPEWNYDGSSTGQAPTDSSEVVLKPVNFIRDKFRNIDNAQCYLVLCETFFNGAPHSTNHRHRAVEIFNQNLDAKPMFGLELEFFITRNNVPLGMQWYPNHFPEAQGNYYCGVGASNAIGRECIEHALKMLVEFDISITGLNAEVAPSQWEFQVCNVGIDACDHFIFMRYILEKTAENYNLDIEYNPKPVKGDWNGSGCHVNFSTVEMREEGGYEKILQAINRLQAKHDEHMEIYGSNNDERLTGKHETARYDTFSYGVANRGCSIRIPRTTNENQRGYLEDRRPASNIDPYRVCSKIFETCSL